MSSDAVDPPEASPVKPSKRLRTRERLLDVAAELFQARGISAVSLDQVAARAGLTKGAIYGSFASKDDLVLAVANERARRALVAFDDSAPVREQLRALVGKAFRGAALDRAHFAFMAELDLYALGREKLSRRFVEAARHRHLQSAARLERYRDELALPPLQFAIAAQALLGGLLFQHACFPEAMTESVALAALEGLLLPAG